MNKYKAGIVGFSGYSGAELVRLLTAHPQAEPILLEHRQDQTEAPTPLNHPQPRRAPCTPDSVRTEGLAVVFLATPPEVSMELAPVMLDAGAKVIDLSGAFRLRDEATYSRWYKQEHTAPQFLAEAVYGLPEFCRQRIRTARLIANPGCYPTAANLAIQPLIASGVADRSAGIVCDAKSGVSGAGRKASLKTSFCEVADNFSVYSVLDHRHVAEVLMVSGLDEPELSFTAHLLPIHRGILETIYVRTRNIKSAEDLLEIYLRQYKTEKFVRLYQPGSLPDLAQVNRTNFCDIGFKFDAATGRAVIVSAIDNLVKGAAGQAIQNMNLVLGCERKQRDCYEDLVKVLIKLGGTLLDSEESRQRLAREVSIAVHHGIQAVVVHGGGKQMTRYLADHGIESRFVHGLRVTTPEVLAAVIKILAGSVNQELVSAFVACGAPAVGLSGMDALLTEARQMSAELGWVGKPVQSDARLLNALIELKYIPVVACVAGDRQGRFFNVNADQMAVSVAGALRADKLLFLTDVDGVKDQNNAVLSTLNPEQCRSLIDSGVAVGGMQAKLHSAIEALQTGIAEVVIAPGAVPNIVGKLLSGDACGTRLVASPAVVPHA